MLKETNVVILGYRPPPPHANHGATDHSVPGPHHRDITLGTTPVDSPRTDLYNKQRSQEADIQVSDRIQTRNPSKLPQNHALHRAATGIGMILGIAEKNIHSTNEKPFIYNMF